jgi:hypothetical protein
MRTRDEVAQLRAENAALRAEVERLRAMQPMVDVLDQEDATTTTVVARIHATGVEHTKRLAWHAGSAVRAEWEREYRCLPPKANTAKVSGRGSHCHARYPRSWSDRIDAIVRSLAGDSTVQTSLPFAPE